MAKVDQYKLIISKGKTKYDFSGVMQSPTWRSHLDTLGSQLSFSVPLSSYDPSFPKVPIEIGNQFIYLNNNKEIMRGVIADGIEKRNSMALVGYDFAYYLNKSSTVMQFKKIAVDDAIRQLCRKFKIPILNIASMPTLVTKIYNAQVSEILKDLIKLYEDETGNRVRMEMLNGKLRIYKWGDIVVKATYVQPNGDSFNAIHAVGADYQISRSMGEMKNSIIVTSGVQGATEATDKKGAKPGTIDVFATVEDAGSIKNYGLLQDVIVLDKKEAAKAKQVGSERLKELNQTSEEVTLPLLGDDSLIAGRLLDLTEASIGLKGLYMIVGATHTSTNGIHRADVILGKPKKGA